MQEYKKEEIIQHRIDKSYQSYQEALYLTRSGFYSGAVNSLYYSCYHMVNALLQTKDIKTASHAELGREFKENFIKTSKIEQYYCEIYGDVIRKKNEIDHGDFIDYREIEIQQMLSGVNTFINRIQDLISEYLQGK